MAAPKKIVYTCCVFSSSFFKLFPRLHLPRDIDIAKRSSNVAILITSHKKISSPWVSKRKWSVSVVEIGKEITRTMSPSHIRHLVPPEGVFRGNGRRDVGRPRRKTHPAPSAAMAVPSTRRTGSGSGCCRTASHSSIAGEIPTKESTAHQSWAAPTHLLHVRRASADGAGPSVRLLLPLVAPGNHEHGRAIRSSDRNRTAHNTSRGAPLLRRLLAIIVVRKRIRSIAGVVRVASALAVCALATERRAKDDIDGRVDLHCQIVNQRSRVVIERRAGDFNIQPKALNIRLRV